MQKTYTVTDEWHQQRLDFFLTSVMLDYSRSYFKRLVDEKSIMVNGQVVSKSGFTLRLGDVVVVTFPDPRTFTEHHASDVCLNSGIEIIYQESDFAIIYKPAGIVTHHPSEKSTEFSVVDWLTYTFSGVKEVGYTDRPGIIHRLDKDTSGLMIVALSNKGHKIFGHLFHERKITKVYYALVHGITPATGTITAPIGRNPLMPHRMAVVANGRPAVTHYKALEYYKEHTLLEVVLETGRTHQIRVHCAYIKHPLEGDSVYGKISTLISRQALHAAKLSFEYEGKHYSFQKQLPDDFESVLKVLKADLTF